MRVSKVTTRTGDKGQTDLGDGTRVPKNNVRIELIGSIDHLNSIIGWSMVDLNTKLKKDLQSIQQDLFNIGAELSIPNSSLNLMKDARLSWVDKKIKDINSELPPLKEFILPGGSEISSRIHIARTECRKVERNYVDMRPGEHHVEITLDPTLLKELLDYELQWDLSKGLKETIKYYEKMYSELY